MIAANSDSRQAGVLTLFVFVSVTMGLLAAALDVRWLAAGLAGLVAVSLVFYDYRAGVVCLTVLLPWAWSPLLPQTRGFNLINFLVFASLVSFAARRSFRRQPSVPLPKVVWWCYLLPVVAATLLALPHLSQGAANFPAERTGLVEVFSPYQFMTGRIIKPMFLLLYAFLAANAIRDSKKPERFLVAMGVSVSVPALAIIAITLHGANVMTRESFLEGLGMHVNEYGMLLSLAVGPMLFVASGSGARRARLAAGLAFVVVSAAILLTASRGAAVAFAVVMAAWLIKRRKFSDMLVALLLGATLLAVAPDSVTERLLLGLNDLGATNIHNMDDPLTKGRLASWAALAPDIGLSPVWGRGVGSTAWNAAVTSGRYMATHPHNMYLEVLLDLGILGFLAIGYLYYRYGRTMLNLAQSSAVSPRLKEYFQGAFASFLGMLAFAVTNGHYMPHPEQTFWWFSLGFVFAFWTLGQEAVKRPQRLPRRVGAYVPSGSGGLRG